MVDVGLKSTVMIMSKADFTRPQCTKRKSEIHKRIKNIQDIMSAESADSKGGDTDLVNVLDDILDGNPGDIDWNADIGDHDKANTVKPTVKATKTVKTVKSANKSTAAAKAKLIKAKGKVTTKGGKTVVKKVVKKEEVVPEKEEEPAEVPAEESEAVEVTPVEEAREEAVSPKKTNSAKAKEEKPVKVKKVVSKPTPAKQAKKVPKKAVAKKQEKVEKLSDEEVLARAEELLNETEEKFSEGLADTEDAQPSTEGMETHDYDTRSEASGMGNSSLSEEEEEEEDEDDLSESGIMSWDKKYDLCVLSIIHVGSELDGDEEEGKTTKKGKKRGISPIEWDRNSEDKSEEEEEEEAGEEAKSDDAKSEKSESSTSRYISSRMKYIFRNARFFLIKSNNHENVALAKAKGVWSTPPQNEIKLNQAYRSCDNVILIFSVKESGKFQGFARIADESTKDHPPIRWVLPPGLSARALSGVFKLDWINRRDLAFTKTTHLHNSWNDNKPVKIGRDGQEIEPRCGETLCKMFPSDDNVDLTSIVRKARKASRGLKVIEDRRDSFRGGRRGDLSSGVVNNAMSSTTITYSRSISNTHNGMF
ncbi:hypothetical protein KUTeg_016840 [Tegillarca granosa]|uniref:YTH domain-containing protein n=1 Tax=Tegillarca granosa TaxID=220873 RepID=A0ABQ9ERW2_TEGGR|nr:hypothetical protein KUTeg_016840 [Tegillarca granosa]